MGVVTDLLRTVPGMILHRKRMQLCFRLHYSVIPGQMQRNQKTGSYLPGFLIAACAAARRAMGTRKGLQET